MSNLNSILFKKIWPCLFLLLSLLVLVVPAVQSKPAPISAEEKKFLKSLRITPATLWIEAHDFAGEKSDGKKVSLKDFRGSFVFLNFWATWCTPCLKEMPDLEKAYQQMGQKKLVVLAVAMGEGVDKIKSFGEKFGLTFPLVADPELEITKLYGVVNIPVTYLIDPEGIVLGRALGIRDWASPDLLAFIKSQLF